MIVMNSREEVAGKLRRIEEDVDYETAFMEIDTIIGTKDNYSFSFFFNRLADLIDPTCEVVEVSDNDEFMVRVVSGFMCKKCGHEVIVERNCDGWAEPPNYCPHCGARVVRDEA